MGHWLQSYDVLVKGATKLIQSCIIWKKFLDKRKHYNWSMFDYLGSFNGSIS